MIGTTEIIFILVIVLVLFGPNKLPELARAVGGAIGEFKIAQKSAEFDLSGFDAINRENAEKKKAEEKALNERIIKMAEEAGISTQGKTTAELLGLISLKMNETASEKFEESNSLSGTNDEILSTSDSLSTVQNQDALKKMEA
ncbi:MAG: twin-arginine translocase TatA/TatE family subunit [Methanimicrococcus sp.]|nr:twin-arginine translocase TatA/TatE family subunit [Methanimicrococcus sp.]